MVGAGHVLPLPYAAAVLALVLAAGCGTEDFPRAPGQAGARDVPYVTTYNFGFPVRFDRVTGADGNLLIISGGDLLNLISTANITQLAGTGVVSGTVRDLEGTTMANVVLAATDVDGKKLGDFFYNGLGGTPDFVQTRGTVATGGFTMFNVTPGEVYLKAVSGGRGGTRLVAFKDDVSLGLVGVVPVIVPIVGVVGEITDQFQRPVLTGSVSIQVVGQRLSEAGNCNDEVPSQEGVEAVLFATTTAFRFCVASEGDYFAKLFGNDFVPTYFPFQTDRAQLVTQQAVDVTQFFSIQTRRGIELATSRAGLAWRPGTGAIAGRIVSGGGTPRSNVEIIVTDQDGQVIALPSIASETLGTILYLNVDGTPIEGARVTGSQGFFLIINLPVPSTGLTTAYLSITGEEANSSTPERYVRTVISPVIADSVVYSPTNLVVAQPINPADDTFPRYFTGQLSGTVFTEDGLSPVANARIIPLGLDPDTIPVLAADENGNYTITQGSDPGAKTPLLGSSAYMLKVQGPPGDQTYFPTYQRASTGPIVLDATGTAFQRTTQNLTAVPRGSIETFFAQAGLSGSPDPQTGILYGTVIDRETGRPASGIALRIQPFHGGDDLPVFYFGFTGEVSPQLSATTSDGRYLVFNVPPGMVSIDVISPDDTGNGLTSVIADGVTLRNIQVNNGAPETVPLTGTVRRLLGQDVRDVEVSIVGGDPLPQKTTCPSGLFERVGLCYADPGNLTGGTQKLPVPCDESYGPDRILSGDGGYCVVKQGSPDGAFTLDVGSRSDLVVKTTGPGFLDTYTFGITTGEQPIASLSLGVAAQAEIDGVAAAAGQSRDPEKGVIWGRTTAASLGKVDGRTGAVAPIDCAAWKKLPDDPDDAYIEGCSGVGTPGAMATAFFNADGFRDLAVIDTGRGPTGSGPAVTIWLNDGAGSFSRAQRIEKDRLGGGVCREGDAGCGIEDGPVALQVVDVNADGLPDLVVLNEEARSISILYGRGRGKFVLGKKVTEISPPGSFPNAMAIADFNRDGRADLLVTDRSTGRIALFLGTGATFAPPDFPILTQDRVGIEPRAVVSGQLDFDAVPDLVFANRDSVAVLSRIGIGNALFQARYPVEVDPTAVALGDLDQDGFNDVVVADAYPGSPRIWIFINSIFGLINPPVSIPAGNIPGALTLIDVNGDQLLDLVVINQGDGTVLYRTGNGDGDFGPPSLFSVGGRPATLVVDDVSGDGLVDAVLGDPVGVTGPRVLILPQTTRPAEGLAVAAVTADGNQVGRVVYLDEDPQAGITVSPAGAPATRSSGRFAIFDVPPGPIWLRLVEGGTGSRFLQAYRNGVTNTTFQVVAGPTTEVSVEGSTVDAVVRPVGEVQIRFLGTTIGTVSNPILFDQNGNPVAGANYRTAVDANSDYVIKLSK